MNLLVESAGTQIKAEHSDALWLYIAHHALVGRDGFKWVDPKGRVSLYMGLFEVTLADEDKPTEVVPHFCSYILVYNLKNGKLDEPAEYYNHLDPNRELVIKQLTSDYWRITNGAKPSEKELVAMKNDVLSFFRSFQPQIEPCAPGKLSVLYIEPSFNPLLRMTDCFYVVVEQDGKRREHFVTIFNPDRKAIEPDRLIMKLIHQANHRIPLIENDHIIDLRLEDQMVTVARRDEDGLADDPSQFVLDHHEKAA